METERYYTKALCLGCEEIMVSMHRHDFVMCGCDNQTFVDGGCDYSRVGGRDMNKILVWDYKDKAWGKCGN